MFLVVTDLDLRITDLWDKEGSVIKQVNYDVEIHRKLTVGRPGSTAGLLTYIPFDGFVQDITGNSQVSVSGRINDLDSRIRKDGGDLASLVDKNSKNGYYVYFGYDAGSANPRRKVVYRVPVAVGELYDDVSISFCVAITGFLTGQTNNDSSLFFSTREASGIITSTTATGDTIGIEVLFIWNPAMGITSDMVMIRTIILYKNASGGISTFILDVKVPEDSEKFHHILITANVQGIKLYRDKLFYGEIAIPASFGEQGYKIGNISEHCIGCGFDDQFVCRFDASDVAVFTSQADLEFAYNLRAETASGTDTLVVYNQTKMNTSDVGYLSINKVPFKPERLGNYDTGITNQTVGFYRGKTRPIIEG